MQIVDPSAQPSAPDVRSKIENGGRVGRLEIAKWREKRVEILLHCE